jgi:hypothetical protein
MPFQITLLVADMTVGLVAFARALDDGRSAEDLRRSLARSARPVTGDEWRMGETMVNAIMEGSRQS